MPGDVWGCGVYQGGTAAMLAAILADKCPSKRLFLFDTFEGMPETDPDRDEHRKGDFGDTNTESVAVYVGHADLCVIRKGFIPDTFVRLKSAPIAMAHIDVDIYRSIVDCRNFIWPRISLGGFVVFNDMDSRPVPAHGLRWTASIVTRPAFRFAFRPDRRRCSRA